MSDPTAHLPNSAAWSFVNVIVQHLNADAAIQSTSATIKLNPRTPAALGNGALVIVVKSQSDSLISKTGGWADREHRFVLACIARSTTAGGVQDADAQADRLHEAASAAVRDAQALLSTSAAFDKRVKATLSQENIVYQVEGLHVDGALVASTWVFKYQPKKD